MQDSAFKKVNTCEFKKVNTCAFKKIYLCFKANDVSLPIILSMMTSVKAKENCSTRSKRLLNKLKNLKIQKKKRDLDFLKTRKI